MFCLIEPIIESKSDENLHRISMNAAHHLYLITYFFDIILTDT